MPLRDHFRPPVSKKAWWEGFHGGWPMTMIQHLRKVLPPGFVAEPRVHLGAFFEVDAGTYETDATPPAPGPGDGGTATWTAEPVPTVPLWLGADHVLALDLEPSYERACHDRWIT